MYIGSYLRVRYGVVSEIVTVGISSAIDPVILCQIASPTGPVPNVNITCFYQPDFSGLERIFVSIQSLVCSSFGPAVTVPPTTQLPPARSKFCFVHHFGVCQWFFLV